MIPRSFAEGVAALGRAALDLLIPVACAVCGAPGAACCATCLAEFDHGTAFVHGTGVHALAPYGGVARELVLAHKERGRRDLARPLGHALARALPRLPTARPDAAGTWWLVPVPSRPSAARARGGSHVLALARRCAEALAARGSPAAVAPALRLASGARDAVGLGRAQRAANLRGRLRFHPAGAPPGSVPVVLLDDVVTTGATVAACSRVLSDAGFEVTAALTLTGTPAGGVRRGNLPRQTDFVSPTWVDGELRPGRRR